MLKGIKRQGLHLLQRVLPSRSLHRPTESLLYTLTGMLQQGAHPLGLVLLPQWLLKRSTLTADRLEKARSGLHLSSTPRLTLPDVAAAPQKSPPALF